MEFIVTILLILTVCFIASTKKTIFGQKQQRSHLDSNNSFDSSSSRTLSTYKFSAGRGGCMYEEYGYYLKVYLAPHVPLLMLNRHGEYRKSLPSDDSYLKVENGIWLQLSKEEREAGRLLGVVANFGSIGYVPSDGGDLLPYLKCCRKIMERELPPEFNLVESYLRIDELKSCTKGHLYYKSGKVKNEQLVDYFSLVFQSDESALRLILEAHQLEGSVSALSYGNIVQLVNMDFKSIENIAQASDKVLLSLKGIGTKKLAKLRLSLKTSSLFINTDDDNEKV